MNFEKCGKKGKKVCVSGKICNRLTNRCILRNSVAGKKELKSRSNSSNSSNILAETKRTPINLTKLSIDQKKSLVNKLSLDKDRNKIFKDVIKRIHTSLRTNNVTNNVTKIDSKYKISNQTVHDFLNKNKDTIVLYDTKKDKYIGVQYKSLYTSRTYFECTQKGRGGVRTVEVYPRTETAISSHTYTPVNNLLLIKYTQRGEDNAYTQRGRVGSLFRFVAKSNTRVFELKEQKKIDYLSIVTEGCKVKNKKPVYSLKADKTYKHMYGKVELPKVVTLPDYMVHEDGDILYRLLGGEYRSDYDRAGNVMTTDVYYNHTYNDEDRPLVKKPYRNDVASKMMMIDIYGPVVITKYSGRLS
jgi:hypothetical protein